MSSTTATEARVLGDFTLGDQIGEGGFGTVYRAHQRTLDRPAVIKVMRRSLIARPEAVERFVREAKLASRFDHPYAAHVYAFGAEPDGLMWIAMELVRGTPLGELIERSGPLPIDRFVPLMERLCEVIHAAHEQGIVHRDIKPSNVMIISRSGRLIPKLLDFGIAKSLQADQPPPAVVARARRASAASSLPAHTPVELDRTAAATDSRPIGDGALTMEGQILGSPLYMAPEQWTDASTVGPWTDQYALSILAYEVLTGRQAFGGTTLSELAEAHVSAPLPALPADVPAPVHAVLARAAAKNPNERYPNLLDFAAALRAAGSSAADLDEPVALPTALLATWAADAPRPIADAIASLAAARSPIRIADRVTTAARTIARWLGAIAIACRSRLGKLAADEDVELLRELRRRPLREDEWLEVAAALARPFAARPEAWPLPELVGYCTGDAAAGLRALVRGDSPLVALDKTTRLEHQTAVARLGQLAAALGELSWLLDYEVAREVEGGLELWMGQAADERVVRSVQRDGDGRVVLLDGDGARLCALSPSVRVAAPAHGEAEQMFLLAGPGRTPDGARYVAPPHGFEHEAEDTWSWLAAHVLDGVAGAARTHDDERPPYRGLAAFTADDHASFVGREREIEEAVNRLCTQPLLAIVGPSGVGKSSFLAAGVAPALPAGWTAAVLRPGDDPIAALATVVERGDASPYRGGLVGPAPRDPAVLARELVAAAVQRGGTLVIVVDQAEELFTLCADHAQRIAFATALAAAMRDPRVRVVLGVRDDYLCRLEELAPWRGAFARAVHILRVPSAAELERIVAVPARRRGYDFDDPELPAVIAREVEGRPGALPLLAFAASELWEARDRHFQRLTRAAYDRMGGVRGALVQHAEAVIEVLPAQDRRLVRLAFRRLLTADGTRAVIGRAELVTALGGTPAAARVVERLLAARLIVSRDEDAGARVEIVHEALVTAWPRLAEWRREDDAELRIHGQLATAARAWDERGRASGLLWRGDALAELRRWRARSELAMTPVEAAFADASERAATTTRRWRVGVVAGSFATLLTGVLVLAGLNRTVDRQRDDAVRRLASSLMDRGRLAIADDDAARGVVYLAEAQRLGATGAGLDLLIARATSAIESERTLVAHDPEGLSNVRFDGLTAIAIDASNAAVAQAWDRASHHKVGPAISNVFDVRPLDQRVAVLANSGDVIVTDRDGTPRWRAPHAHDLGHTAVAGVVGSAAGDVVASFGGDARLWRLSDGTPLGELSHPDAMISQARFDPAGRRLATADLAGGVRVWDAANGSPVASCPGHTGRVRSLAFSSDGKLLASGGDDRNVVVCDPATGALRLRLEGHANPVASVELSHDGRTLVSSSSDSTARLWEVATGKLIGILYGHHGTVFSARFSLDDRYVLTGGADGTARVWDATGGTPLAVLQDTGATIDADWEPGGRVVTTADTHGVIRQWDVSRALRGVGSRQHAGGIRALAVSADGKWSASAASDGVVLWDLAGDVPRATIHAEAAAHASFSDDGAVVAVVDGAGGGLWSVPDGAQVRRLAPGIVNAVFAPGGILITGDHDGVLQLWDPGGQELARFAIGFAPDEIVIDPAGRWAIPIAVYGDPHETEAPVIDLRARRIVARLRGQHTAPYAVAAEQTRLATNDGSDVVLWDTASWQPVARLVGHTGPCTALAFLPDGRLISSADDRTTLLWGRDGKLLSSLTSGGARVWALAPSHDGAMFATGSNDGVVRLWDAATLRQLLALPSHLGSAGSVAFTPDDGALLSAGSDGRVVRWNTHRPHRTTAELAQLIHCRVAYRFTGDDVVPAQPAFDDPSCR